MNRTLLMGALIASTAGAAQASFSQVTLRIEATSALGTAVVEINQAMGIMDPGTNTYSWQLGGERISMIDPISGNVIAFLDSAAVTLIEDPSAAVSFSVAAAGADTSFNVTSGLVSFTTLNNPTGTASAQVDATDFTGDGVTMTGDLAGGAMFGAYYNGLGPGGTNFAALIASPLSTGFAFDSVSTSQNYPAGVGATEVINASVFDMSAVFGFTLSAGDIASGSGVFTVVPAPMAATPLALGALAFRRRR